MAQGETKAPIQHHIVSLDSPFAFKGFDFPNTTSTYHKSTTPAEAGPRMTDATIVMLGTTRLSYDTIMNHCPKTQLITSMGTGVDNIDAAAIRERGITLCNVPAQNIESVSEHAIALLMALKRRIVPAQAFVRGEGQWTGVPTSLAMFGGLMPRTNADEVVGIVGYGGLGES